MSALPYDGLVIRSVGLALRNRVQMTVQWRMSNDAITMTLIARADGECEIRRIAGAMILWLAKIMPDGPEYANGESLPDAYGLIRIRVVHARLFQSGPMAEWDYTLEGDFVPN